MIVLKHSHDHEYWYWYDEETWETSQPFDTQEGAIKAKNDDTLDWCEDRL